MPKAIIIGSSSGIGKELARILSRNGYILGLVARRIELLSELQDELKAKTFIKQVDIAQIDQAIEILKGLISEMGGIDVVIICAAVYLYNQDLLWNIEKNTIDINVLGFCAAVNVFFHYFAGKGSGHIVGISSIASYRGDPYTSSYNASKAFVSNYMEGLQKRVRRERMNIQVTLIEPGYVDTPMVKNLENRSSIMSVEVAALEIFDAIKKKKDHVYVTNTSHFLVWIKSIIPRWLYKRLRS